MKVEYNTRDAKGNDFVKEVEIKQFAVNQVEFVCPICHRHVFEGVELKKAVSANFTDWAYVDDYVCKPCSELLSLFFYSYSVENGKIRLYNVREIYSNIMRKHELPFKFIITKSQKKHLFYLATENLSDKEFAIQLETETIFTNRERMKTLFDFIECMITLGAGKRLMLEGKLPRDILLKPFGTKAISFLQEELRKSREIQIPLHCGQKREITEEEAICCIISTLKI